MRTLLLCLSDLEVLERAASITIGCPVRAPGRAGKVAVVGSQNGTEVLGLGLAEQLCWI